MDIFYDLINRIANYLVCSVLLEINQRQDYLAMYSTIVLFSTLQNDSIFVSILI